MEFRCGVAGLGRGRSFVDKLGQVPGCEVVAVCDSNEKALADYGSLACYTDYEEFIREAGLDVVAAITPGPVHAEQSVLAMENGAHVLCETPCVYSLEEAQQVVDTVRKTGLKYMLAENYVYMGWVEACQKLVDDGRLGEIVYAEGEYTHDCRGIMYLNAEGRYLPFQEKDQHPDARLAWRATDLPPLKYCSHTLGPLLHLMNDRCVSVCGMSTGSKTLPDVPTNDMETGIMKTARGAVIRLTNGFCIAHPFALFYGLYGTRGTVKFLNIGGTQVKFYTDDEPDKGWQDLEMPWSERADGRDGVTVMIEEYIQSIRDDTDPPIDVFRSMDYTVPGICASFSGERDGEKIDVPDYRAAGAG